jgi:hypothetical protein
MTQRTTLLAAAGLTAFVLVLLGGLAVYLTQPAAPASVPAAGAGNGPATPAALAPDREAAYQAALQEAQVRLTEANRRLAEAAASRPAPVLRPPPPAAPTPPAARAYAVSADQALLVALGSAPGAAPNAPPELVRYQDRVAYEVRLDQGPIYVDATSGQVLYNGAAGSVLAAAGGSVAPAPTGHDDEHERAEGAHRNEHANEAGNHNAGADD